MNGGLLVAGGSCLATLIRASTYYERRTINTGRARLKSPKSIIDTRPKQSASRASGRLLWSALLKHSHIEFQMSVSIIDTWGVIWGRSARYIMAHALYCYTPTSSMKSTSRVIISATFVLFTFAKSSLLLV